MKQPKIYLITDTHFYHDNMIPYCGRPENFTELVGINLLKVGFTEDDLLIHLGDICIGNDQLAHDLYIKPLRCKKWLVKGNHDHKSNHWYLNNGWDWVGSKFQDKFFGKNIMFSHAPQHFEEIVETQFGAGSFDLNIHGHFHNNMHRLLEGRYVVDGEKERNEVDLANLTPRHKLLSLEYSEYKPVLLENFISNN